MKETAKKTIALVAVDYLIETDNPGVMWGDAGLLDSIGTRAGIRERAKHSRYVVARPGSPHPLDVWTRVLAGLERRPDLFEKMASKARRWCRVFYLTHKAFQMWEAEHELITEDSHPILWDRRLECSKRGY